MDTPIKMKDRTIKKTLRFNQNEWQLIEDKLNASGLTFSNFTRAALLQKRVVSRVHSDMLYEINKIGVNLNQIARAANSQDEKVHILIKLVEIEQALKKII